MPQPEQREPRYAPGCPEDSLYNGSYIFQTKRRRKSRLINLLALLIVICIGLLYWKTQDHLPVNHGSLDAEITSIDRGATSNIIYVNITVSNNTGLPFYDVSAIATLYDEAYVKVDRRSNQLFSIIAAGESKNYTFSFNSKNYTSVQQAEISINYNSKP